MRTPTVPRVCVRINQHGHTCMGAATAVCASPITCGVVGWVPRACVDACVRTARVWCTCGVLGPCLPDQASAQFGTVVALLLAVCMADSRTASCCVHVCWWCGLQDGPIIIGDNCIIEEQVRITNRCVGNPPLEFSHPHITTHTHTPMRGDTAVILLVCAGMVLFCFCSHVWH